MNIMHANEVEEFHVGKKVPHPLIFGPIRLSLPSDFLKTRAHLTKLAKFNQGDLDCTLVCEIMEQAMFVINKWSCNNFEN